jgi:hypothetical protein
MLEGARQGSSDPVTALLARASVDVPAPTMAGIASSVATREGIDAAAWLVSAAPAVAAPGSAPLPTCGSEPADRSGGGHGEVDDEQRAGEQRAGQHCDHGDGPADDGSFGTDLGNDPDDGASARAATSETPRATGAAGRAGAPVDDAARLGEALRGVAGGGASAGELAEAATTAGLRAGPQVPVPSPLGNDLYAQVVLGQYVLSAHRQLAQDEDERRRRRARTLAGMARKPDVSAVEGIDADGGDPEHQPGGDSETRRDDHQARDSDTPDDPDGEGAGR